MKVLAMVAVLVLAASAVQAQDICVFSDEVSTQASKFVSKPAVKTDGINQVYERFRGGVTDLCRIKPSEAAFEAGEADVWLVNADMVASHLADDVFTNLLPPQTANSLNRLRVLANYVGAIQNILQPRRVQAYQAVRVETRVETKTVTLPAPPAQIVRVAAECAPCPECPQGPTLADMEEARQQEREGRLERCHALFRPVLVQWKGRLSSLGNAAPVYDVRSGVLQLASSMESCVFNGYVQCKETIGANAVAWQAQLQRILENDARAENKASSIIRPQLEGILIDLETRVNSCEGGRRRR